MPSLPSRSLAWRLDTSYLRKHLNFFRVHLLSFTFLPLIFSAIFYASNGEFHISYIDALFNCISAMTVTGLATIDLSTLTPWQQTIMFIQMCLGSPVFVSWIIVYIRRHFFAKKFEFIMQHRMRQTETALLEADVEARGSSWRSRFGGLMRRRQKHASDAAEKSSDTSSDTMNHKGRPMRRQSLIKKLRTDMIRRMDDAPKLVNPSGWISEGTTAVPHEPHTPPATPIGEQGTGALPLGPSIARADPSAESRESDDGPKRQLKPLFLPTVREREEKVNELLGKPPRRIPTRRLSDPGASPQISPVTPSVPMSRFKTIHASASDESEDEAPQPPTTGLALPRTQTVEFALAGSPRRSQFPRNEQRSNRFRSMSIARSENQGTSLGPNLETINSEEHRSIRRSLRPTNTMHSAYSVGRSERRSKHSGFGGFPMPHEIATTLLHRFFPNAHSRLHRTMTVPMTATLTSHAGTVHPGARTVPYISFDTIVGRNSAFVHLSNEQLEELGGVEYRALNALLWIIPFYHIGLQLTSFVVIAPYISQSRWKDIFVPPNLHRKISPIWFTAYQVVSAYTNTGMSLVDQSMVPFQKAYPMIVIMAYLVLAGNTAFPVFFRLLIWLMTKLIRNTSRLNETLHFLLDHPRRCYIYLFPSHQTWFLLTVVVSLTLTDWFFFLVLDIGNSAIESISIGTRFAVGLLQAVAVRAAGFGTVPLSALAPAVKVLYVLMMYVSVYPIAMSVRSTNVYEEKSLGIFEDEEDSVDDEFQPTGRRIHIWSQYVGMHARRQLSFDMWWMGLALFLICIIERENLDDPEKGSYFNIFNIIFELVSAYGTVGLSLGTPYANYSFCGAFKPLSKLILCAVMLRGRHRGLPVAIDRAVMLPFEFRKQQANIDAMSEDARSASFDPTRSTEFTRTRSRFSNGNDYAPNEKPLSPARAASSPTSFTKGDKKPVNPTPTLERRGSQNRALSDQVDTTSTM